MKKPYIVGAVILIILVIVGILAISKKTRTLTPAISQEGSVQAFDARNAAFVVDGREIVLANGSSELPIATGSATKVATRYFGNEARGDLNGDGSEDIAFLISQTTGGSGTFYYAVVALKTADGYQTTNAFLIGDRIAPQSTVIPTGSRELQINYADRKIGEPMTAQPTQGKTLLLKVTAEGVLEGLSQ